MNSYLAKGGKLEDTTGRKCLCNALLANGGFPQVISTRDGLVSLEPPLITAGDDLSEVARFLTGENATYTAENVLRHLLSQVPDSLFAQKTLA